MEKLTIKQERFCQEYAKSGNATDAYKRAGYSVVKDTAAAVNANRLLKTAKVVARLKEIADKVSSSKIMGIAEMQERLSRIARREETEKVFTASGEIEAEASLKDSMKAMELLGKMQGAFINTTNINVAGTVPVIIRDDVGDG